MSIRDAPSEMPVVPLTENTEVQIRGDLGSDVVAIDSQISSNVNLSLWTHPADDIFPFLDDFDNSLIAVVIKSGFHVEYATGMGEFWALRYGKSIEPFGTIVRTAGVDVEESQVVPDGCFEYYGGPEPILGQVIADESADTSELEGGEGFTEWPHRTPQWPDWYLWHFDDDDSFELTMNHDQNTSNDDFITRIYLEYVIAEPI